VQCFVEEASAVLCGGRCARTPLRDLVREDPNAFEECADDDVSSGACFCGGIDLDGALSREQRLPLPRLRDRRPPEDRAAERA
jgi:hypothetical protein